MHRVPCILRNSKSGLTKFGIAYIGGAIGEIGIEGSSDTTGFDTLSLCIIYITT